MSADSGNVTQLLQDWSKGNQQALEELLPLICNELRHLAHNFLYRERPGHTPSRGQSSKAPAIPI